MPESQKIYFINQLQKSTNYLEFGSGGSTFEANKYVKNKVYSVESDELWINKINSYLIDNNNNKITFFHIDIETIPNNWGYPGQDCSDEKKQKYSNIMDCIDDPYIIDTILIDGRFRVACALNILPYITKNTIVIFDDFLNRQHQYGIVLEYYDIVKKIDNMVELSKKEDITCPDEIIKKYELIAQ